MLFSCCGKIKSGNEAAPVNSEASRATPLTWRMECFLKRSSLKSSTAGNLEEMLTCLRESFVVVVIVVVAVAVNGKRR